MSTTNDPNILKAERDLKGQDAAWVVADLRRENERLQRKLEEKKTAFDSCYAEFVRANQEGLELNMQMLNLCVRLSAARDDLRKAHEDYRTQVNEIVRLGDECARLRRELEETQINRDLWVTCCHKAEDERDAAQERVRALEGVAKTTEEYILRLRQAIYAGDPAVMDRAYGMLDACGSAYTAALSAKPGEDPMPERDPRVEPMAGKEKKDGK